MEISGILSAIVIGLVIGALGRLVVKGKQHMPVWQTIVVGILAAFLGTAVAGAVDVADTPGIDWIELFLQIGIAGLGVAAVTRTRRRRTLFGTRR